jgi:hypothetical protein
MGAAGSDRPGRSQVSKRIVCTICGSTVLTFANAEDVDPDRLFAVLERELARHLEVIDDRIPPLPEGAEAPGPGDAATWSRTLHLFQVVDDDNEADDLEEELENPELFFYGDMQGWW